MSALSLSFLSTTASAIVATDITLAASRTRCTRVSVVSAHLVSVSRRSALSAALSLVTGMQGVQSVAAAGQDPKDLTRMPTGLNDVQYLLDHWDAETINPTSGAQDPDRVRLWLGLRTTTSPLFQIDRLLTTAQNDVDPDRFDEWIEASEGWNSHVNKVNELAYTSSFGEYNPGGGKEQVAKYLDLARAEVVLCRDSLKTMISLIPKLN